MLRALRQAASARVRIAQIFRAGIARSGPAHAPRLALDFFLRSPAGQSLRMRFGRARPGEFKEYTAELPAGFPAQRVAVRLSIPALPRSRMFEFTEHAGDLVLAVSKGGFAISHDLGASWTFVGIQGYGGHQFLHVKSIGDGEYLAQAVRPDWNRRGRRRVDILVVDDHGNVRAQNRIDGSPWHACRAVDFKNGTLMYAEYPYDVAASMGARFPSRVLRSRDRGRSWDAVFEQSGADVRHFHFLQARPGVPGEWWLTSGDKPAESHIWVSRDDGDTWESLTDSFGDQVAIDGVTYPRAIFRLTDLVWDGTDVLWGTDDLLQGTKKDTAGPRVFKSPATGKLIPRVIGRCRWPVRNIVDAGDVFLLMTQGSIRPDARPEEKRPGVFLAPKHAAPVHDVVHLFDAEIHSAIRTAFTYSKASRAAKDGVFFTARSGTDIFPYGHKILKWEVWFS